MADRYLLESGAPDGYLLEDSSGVLLLEGGLIEIASGLATETDAAIGIAHLKIRAAGISAETDAGLALVRTKLKATGISTETDAGVALGRLKQKPIGISSEADLALPLARVTAIAVGLAQETDAGFGLDRTKILAIALASEIDSAFSTYPVPPTLLSVGAGLELDQAYAPLLRRIGAMFVIRRPGARA